MKITWFDEAVTDMEKIYEFLGADSNQSAARIFNQIVEESQRLILFPRIAPLEPLLSEEPLTYRSLVVRSHYKIIYFVDEENEQVVIVKVWDCRQNPESLRVN